MNNNFPLIFLGDHHGNWHYLFYQIDKHNLKDCYIISVGDCGIGFSFKEKQLNEIEKFNDCFKSKNIHFKAIRGNHDNPLYFKGKDRICLDHFELIEDYTICNYKEQTIQFIGGAISIDRTGRSKGVSYWEDEGVVFDRDSCQKVDILVTHTAPSYCFPQQFNEIVYGWAKEDSYLIKDLTEERAVMDEIFKICQPKLHLYGHFHTSVDENINQCRHKLLNIDELWEAK